MMKKQEGISSEDSRIRRAKVIENVDPDKNGRVQIAFYYWLSEEHWILAWATLLSPYASQDAGWHIFPEKGDYVLTACFYENGEQSHLFILGAWYPLEKMLPKEEGEKASFEHQKKFLKTQQGHQLVFNDDTKNASILLQDADKRKIDFSRSKKKLEIADASGNAIVLKTQGPSLVIQTSGASIEISAEAISIKKKAQKILLSSTSIEITNGTSEVTVSNSQVKVQAAASIQLGSMAMQGLIKAEFLALFNTHIHATAMGPSGPPLMMAGPTVCTTKTKAE